MGGAVPMRNVNQLVSSDGDVVFRDEVRVERYFPHKAEVEMAV